MTVFEILKKTFAPTPGAGNTMEVEGYVVPIGALLVEILYTFALALVVLNVATAKKTQGNSFYGLAIGFTVTVAAFAGGSISGGAFNPAVGTGPTIVHAQWGGGTYDHLWLYLVGPFTGAVFAAIVFRIQEYGSADAA